MKRTTGDWLNTASSLIGQKISIDSASLAVHSFICWMLIGWPICRVADQSPLDPIQAWFRPITSVYFGDLLGPSRRQRGPPLQRWSTRWSKYQFDEKGTITCFLPFDLKIKTSINLYTTCFNVAIMAHGILCETCWLKFTRESVNWHFCWSQGLSACWFKMIELRSNYDYSLNLLGTWNLKFYTLK